MKTIILLIGVFILFSTPSAFSQSKLFQPQTRVEIKSEKWFINGKPTLENKKWRGYNIEGLLPNSRMVQGIYDDLNPQTAALWKYPDNGKWDAKRNNQEFLAAMLGVQRTTVTAFAGEQQKRGLIRHARGKVELLDTDGLEKAACECRRVLVEQRKRLAGTA